MDPSTNIFNTSVYSLSQKNLESDLSLVRFSGGILVVVLQQNPSSIGLIIASTILLGVGVPPLMFATMRFIATAYVYIFAPSSFRSLMAANPCADVLLGLNIYHGYTKSWCDRKYLFL